MQPDGTPSAPPLLTVHFGDPTWQTHLGGDFHAPEGAGGISWIWMGEGKCWVILPDTVPPALLHDSDLQVRLEAAPHWPVASGHDIMEIAVTENSGVVIQGMASRPEDDAIWQTLPLQIPFRGTNPTAARPHEMTLHAGKRAALTLDIRSDSQPLATMTFDHDQLIQTRDFLIPRGALGASRTLYFHPSSAIAPVELARDHPDTRKLSFRLFRMQVRPARQARPTTS